MRHVLSPRAPIISQSMVEPTFKNKEISSGQFITSVKFDPKVLSKSPFSIFFVFIQYHIADRGLQALMQLDRN